MDAIIINEVPSFRITALYETLCAILYHLHNLRKACNFTKINTPPRVFFTFLKLHKWYQIVQSVSYYAAL